MVNIQIFDNNLSSTISHSKKKIHKIISNQIWGYNPNELICSALGACIGRLIVKWCLQHKLSVNIFNSIAVNMENNTYTVYIISNMKIDTDDLESKLIDCEISKQLSTKIKIDITINTKLKQKTTKNCCGG